MYADLIQENATVTGTGPITLAGNVTGWRKYSDAFGSGKKVRYFIRNESQLQWEAGEGVFTIAGPDLLSRDKVVRSSNANNLVNFDDSAKIVICSVDADTIRFGVGAQPTASGAADARTVAHDPPITVLRDGMRVRFRNGAAANATTTPTLAIDGFTAKPWRLRDGAQPAAGDFAASIAMEVEYHEASDQWRMAYDLKAQMLTVTSPASLSASQNDWNPTGLSGAGAIRITSSNDIDLTGLTAVGDSRALWLHNVNAVGGKSITLKDESASSAAANRFAMPGDYVLLPDQSVQIQYDATTQRWRVAGYAAEKPPAPVVGFKNRIINGDFSINQRLFTSVADAAYHLDRWYALADGGNVTIAQQSNQENGSPFSLRLTQPDVSAKRIAVAQAIETVNCRDLRGQSVALSARVRCSASQAIRYAVLEHTGTADAITRDVVNNWASGTYTASNFFIAGVTVVGVGSITPAANTWTAIAALTGAVSASANNLIVLFWTEGAAAQNVTLDVARVQLEPGSTATTFEAVEFGEQLRRCQRYWRKSYALGVAIGAADYSGSFAFWSNSGGAAAGSPQFAPMRAAPTIVAYSPASGSSGVFRDSGGTDRAASISQVSECSLFVSGSTAGGAYNNMHFTASAEL